MEPVILFKHPRYHTFYVRFSRLEKPPHGKLLSMKKIVGYAVTDERKAKDILRELKINWHKRKVVELSGASYLKLSGLAERYGADPDRVNHSPDTHQNDRNALRQLRKVIGDKFVSAITKQDIKTFKSLLLGRGVKAYTINNYRCHIMAALRWAKENGYTNNVPKFKKLKTPKLLPRVIPKTELDAVLAACRKAREDLYRMAIFSLWTGCRRSEVLGLRWEDVGEDSIKIRGKGEKERMIPLLAQARGAMGEPRDIGRVFPKMHRDRLSTYFSTAAASVGVKARFHDLRHTSATNMISSGIDLPVVQRILGHSDVRTTQIYAKVVDRLAQIEMQKLRF